MFGHPYGARNQINNQSHNMLLFVCVFHPPKWCDGQEHTSVCVCVCVLCRIWFCVCSWRRGQACSTTQMVRGTNHQFDSVFLCSR